MKRPLLWAAIGLLIGIYLILHHFSFWIILLFLILNLFLFHFRKSLILWPVIGLFLGLFTGICYQNSKHHLVIDETSQVAVLGVVKEHNAHGFLMRIVQYDTGSGAYSVNPFYSFFVTVSSDTLPELYSQVIVEGTVNHYTGPSNPGQFDASSYYPAIGSLYNIRAEDIRTVKPPGLLRSKFTLIRTSITARIRLLFPGTSSGLPAALLLGDKGVMEEENRNLYERFGLAHILTISGLHIGLLGNLLIGVFIFFFERKLSDRIVLFLLILYGLLCGFRISCIRAIFTFMISIYGRRVRRSFDRISANSFLLMIVLFLKPYALMDLSFQLSFGAGFLLAFAEAKGNEQRKMRKVWNILRTSTVLQIGLLPFQVQSFYTFSPFGITFNLLLLLLIEVLFLLTFGAVIISFVFLPAGFFLAGPVYYSIRLFESILKVFGRIRILTVPLGHQSMSRLVIYAVLFGIILYLDKRSMKPVWIGLLILWIILFPNHAGVTRVINLSVGQGDCAVIMKGRNVLVIDCGSLSKSEVGETILKPCLLYYGYGSADYVFLSHTDEDHINGIRNCTDVFGNLKSIFVDSTYRDASELLQPAIGSCEIVYTSPGDSVRIGSARIRFIKGPDEQSDDPNDRCQMLELSVDGNNFLFLGDVSSKVLEEADRHITDMPYLIKVPHHGSKYSLNESFYQNHRARVYAISVGYNNYGHPAKEVTELLNSLGKCYITKDCGAVITTIRNQKAETISMLK